MKSENLVQYFRIYTKFISRDLYISLRPVIERKKHNDITYSVGGRQEYVLYKFLEVFKLIVSSNAPQKMIKEALDAFSLVVDVYLQDNEDSSPLPDKMMLNTEMVGSGKMLQLVYDHKAQNIYEFLFDAMSHLKKHSSSYKEIIKTVKSQEQSRNIPVKTVLTQGIIEFSNALAHFLFVLMDNKDDNNNLGKAFAHIHRATLDNYKAMIKNLEIDEIIKNKLIQLRFDEFMSLGIPTTDEQKEQIIERYKGVVLDMLVDFPKNAYHTK